MMAIHTIRPGLVATIDVNQQPLPEHDDPDSNDGDTIVTKYIEARSGEEFAIHVQLTEPGPTDKDMQIAISMDGSQVHSRVVWGRDITRPEGHDVVGVINMQESSRILQKFCFGDLSTVEDAEGVAGETRSSVETLGTIKVEMRFGHSVQQDHLPRYNTWQLRAPVEVSEKAMKGNSKSLQVVSGSTKRLKDKKHVLKFFPDEALPFATFMFKYRSRLDLEKLHIVSRDITAAESSNSAAQHEAPNKDEEPNIEPTVSPPTSLSNNTNSTAITKQEILVLIEHYRGDVHGLQGLPEQDLLRLLASYRNELTPSSEIKREPGITQSGRQRVKREREDDGTPTPRPKNVRYEDAIELD